VPKFQATSIIICLFDEKKTISTFLPLSLFLLCDKLEIIKIDLVDFHTIKGDQLL